MRQYLLPPEGAWFKANLHCHSNVSDGRLTPAEIKALYTEKGYAIVAFTDHNVLIGHEELCDEHFLALHGYEMDFTERSEKAGIAKKTCHLCLIALDEKNLKQVCFHREKYLLGNCPLYRDQVQFDESEPDFERDHTPEIINTAIRKAKEGGFFVTYNHPAWSLENFADYSAYEGLDAVEMYNFDCIRLGLPAAEQVYDDLLRSGKRVFCLGGDDNHNMREVNNEAVGAEHAFTMIRAKELSYPAVSKALQKGAFYASLGPAIHGLWVEDGVVTIQTSAVQRIVMQTDCRVSPATIALAEKGKPLTEASFEWKKEYGYVRFMLFDERGASAATRAYFPDELL